ncbi:MAG TPA: helix-turn-helix transcriptional regulator [Candidatus Nitrosocosmicus sp.]|nr:helix-turn-helix transcriptional regulator [Candidatus Nitrosocosmicus sp.]
MSEFGNRLQLLRKRKDMSLEELAKAVNSTKSTLSKYERGVVYPTLDSAKVLADYFSVTVDWLSGYGDIDSEKVTLINMKDLESLQGLPKTYIEVLKDAINAGFSPEELQEIVELAKKFRGR